VSRVGRGGGRVVPGSGQFWGRHVSPGLQHPPPRAGQLRLSPPGSGQLWRCHVSPRAGRGGDGRIGRRQPNQHGGGVDLAQGWSADVGLTTSVAVAIWRAHNSNLVLRRGRRSDIDGQQGDAIPISDQVKQKDSNSRLKASRREPSTCPQSLIPHVLKQQRRRCGRCYGLRLWRWRIGIAAA
jgi:hypothetical protein